MNRPTPVVFEMQVLLVNLFHAYVDRVLVSLPVSWNVVEALTKGVGANRDRRYQCSSMV